MRSGHRKRVAEYREAAEAGSPVAQYTLAKVYQTGDGVERDLSEAFHWFAEAAQQDHPASILELGIMFRDGLGVERDFIAGTRCLIVAALLGEVAAHAQLADSLEPLQDFALGGDHTASRFLSDMYGRGLGVDKSPVLAWTWVRWATERCPSPDDEDDSAWFTEAPDRYRANLPDEARRDGDRVFESLLESTQVLRAAGLGGLRRQARGATRREGGDKESA